MGIIDNEMFKKALKKAKMVAIVGVMGFTTVGCNNHEDKAAIESQVLKLDDNSIKGLDSKETALYLDLLLTNCSNGKEVNGYIVDELYNHLKEMGVTGDYEFSVMDDYNVYLNEREIREQKLISEREVARESYYDEQYDNVVDNFKEIRKNTVDEYLSSGKYLSESETEILHNYINGIVQGYVTEKFTDYEYNVDEPVQQRNIDGVEEIVSRVEADICCDVIVGNNRNNANFYYILIDEDLSSDDCSKIYNDYFEDVNEELISSNKEDYFITKSFNQKDTNIEEYYVSTQEGIVTHIPSEWNDIVGVIYECKCALNDCSNDLSNHEERHNTKVLGK